MVSLIILDSWNIGLIDNYVWKGGVCGVHEIKQYHKIPQL